MWENRASLFNHNISQNLHRYFIASIRQTHRFHKFYIHISLSTHTLGGIAKPVAFYWFVTIVWSVKLHFWKCFKGKKAKKWPKSGKIEPVYPTTTFHKIYIDISLCMGHSAGELLVLGLELLFQALCHSSTVLEVFKGLKFYEST